MGFAELVRNARFRSAMSKADLAAKIGISREFVRRIELGESYPSGDLLEQIIAATGMPEQDANHCWEILARHQLDSATQGRVVLYGVLTPKLPPDLMEAVIEEVTEVALDWVSMHYGVSALDLERMRQEVANRLEGE